MDERGEIMVYPCSRILNIVALTELKRKLRESEIKQREGKGNVKIGSENDARKKGRALRK